MPSLPKCSLRVSAAGAAARTPRKGLLGGGGQDALFPSEGVLLLPSVGLPRGMESMIGVAYRTDEVFDSIQE